MKIRKYKLIIASFLPIFLICGCLYNGAISSAPENQFKIAIFKDKGFPSIGTPLALTPEWLHKNISRDFSITYLDSDELSSKERLNTAAFDLLIMPYGEAFPYKAFQNIKEYIFEGGGFLNVAGKPFWAAMEKSDSLWRKADIKDPYAEFLSQLGIKYYESEGGENIGLSVTTSLGFSPLQPTHGNVFPYRIPARDFSKSRENIVFVKSWKNPYVKTAHKIPNKWCLVAAKGKKNPLNPKNPEAQKNLKDIIEYLSFPLVVHELETNFAGYYQGEGVETSMEVVNSGKTAESGVVEIEFLNEAGMVVYAADKPIELQKKAQVTLKETWRPEKFESSFYKVRASLKKDGVVLDSEENGFVVIDRDALKNKPSISIDKGRFIINDEESFILGANYYESRLGELMWLKPNLLRIREDFKAMHELGINFVRIHYHHSKWFRDYFSQVVKEQPDPYFSESDMEPLPSERSLRILDAIIQLSGEQGLIFCMDIFSLVPEEMGNPIGWLGLKERMLDAEKVVIQKEFVKIIANRYKDIPWITWDLWNEPRLEKEDAQALKTWAKEILYAFRKNGDVHLVTVGCDSSLELMDELDYACVHTYEPAEISFSEPLAKPVIFQETWDPAGLDAMEEIRQKDELTKDFKAFLNTNAEGFVPWQWTRQARLWNNASEPERWDDDLGLCVREDGSLKPAGRAYRELISKTKKDAGGRSQAGLK